jgi:hypothetical protein
MYFSYQKIRRSDIVELGSTGFAKKNFFASKRNEAKRDSFRFCFAFFREKISHQLFRFFLLLIFFFSLCFASVFFVSLPYCLFRFKAKKKEAVFPSKYLFSLIFAVFLSLCFFRFVSLFSLRFASFPFRFACKIYCFDWKRNKRKTNPSVSLRSEKTFASVSFSFTSNRKRTAHPSRIGLG